MSQELKLRLPSEQLRKEIADFLGMKEYRWEIIVEERHVANAQLLHACRVFQTFLSRWDELGELSGDAFTAASLKFTEDYGINAEDSSIVECFDSFMNKEGITL